MGYKPVFPLCKMYPTRSRARRTLPCARTPHPSRQAVTPSPTGEGIEAEKTKNPRPSAVVRRAGVFIYGRVSAVLCVADFGMRGLYRGFASRFMCGIFLQVFAHRNFSHPVFMYPALIRFYASFFVSVFFAGTSGFCAAFLRYDFYTGRYDNNSGSNCGTCGKCG